VTRRDVPPRGYHALEAGKQHRGSKMDALIRLFGVAFCRLASRQIREPSWLEVEAHQLGHRQHPIAEMEPALERSGRILGPVAGKVDKVRRRDTARHSVDCSAFGDGFDCAVNRARLDCVLEARQLLVDVPQPSHRLRRPSILGDGQNVDV
jgi:hypothetical protein